MISHICEIIYDVKCQLSLFCKKLYRFSKTVLYIVNRKIHECLEIPDLFLVFRAPMYYSLYKFKKLINNSRGKYKRNECLINVCKSDTDLS